MSIVESNIYKIENLHDLTCQYNLYKIKGLSKDSDDFEKNIQFLIDKLSSYSQSPCTYVKEDNEVFIAQPDGYRDLPSEFKLIGNNVLIEKIPEKRTLDFGKLNSSNVDIAIRFLQFSLQNPLVNDPNLWRPKAGAPFYYKVPDKDFSKMNLLGLKSEVSSN
ncbi:MAG: hypothetical protein K9N07_10040 [Candidatus Cloacimonetes bacterium]|nr:hypothetical protein [Candidatus Cloacimonadota bacterium]